jgi:FKBP-type peptidyl-prolyl cis-trans isomerase (trigger factor)
MKITSNQREENKVVLEVEESYSNFKAQVEKELEKAAKEIELPGFRQGKAPKEMVRKAVKQDVLEAHAAQSLVSDIYPQVIKEANLDPVDFPNIEVIQLKKNKPFIFKITVDVYPEVKLGKYKGIKVGKKKVKVAEEGMMKVLEDVHKRFAKAVPEGEKALALDDEFAKKFSRFGTLAELKADLLQNMIKEQEQRAEAEVKDKLVALAVKEAKVDIPPGLVESEVNVMLEELNGSLAQQGMTLESYLKATKKEEKELRQEIRKSAQIRANGKVVLLAIAKAEKMTISDEEIDGEVKILAQTSGEKFEDVKKRVKEEGRRYIEEYLLRRKALNFLVEKAKITEEPAESGKEEKK